MLIAIGRKMIVFANFSPRGRSRSARVATSEADDDRRRWHDQDPEQRVEQRVAERLRAQQVRVVLGADPLLGEPVLEAVDEGQDRRVDEVERDGEECREDVEVRLEPVLPLAWEQLGDLVEQVVQRERATDTDDDGEQGGECLGHPQTFLTKGRLTSQVSNKAPPGARALDPRPRRSRCYWCVRCWSLLGQLASMFVSAVSRSSWPLIQAVMSFQKVPAPTSPGIWSEPSNRKPVDSVRTLA